MRRVDSIQFNYTGKRSWIVPAPYALAQHYQDYGSYSSVGNFCYPFTSNIRTSSDTTDANSLQNAWDGTYGPIAEPLIPALKAHREYANQRGLPYYVTLQGFAGYANAMRWLTTEEHLCMINLALAYGVDGITYWKYPGNDWPTDSIDGTDGFVTNGYEDSNATTIVWSQVKNVIGPYIEKMGPIFAGLEWDFAWKWGDPPPHWSTIIDITGHRSYLQVGRSHKGGESSEYYMLVNRRCLPTETISGEVHLRWKIEETAATGTPRAETCPDCSWITDMETGDYWQCRRNGFDEVFDYSIAPGAAKLYRISLDEPCTWLVGDADGSGGIDLSDVVYLITYIFGGGPAPTPNPVGSGDADCSGSVDTSDAVYLISYIFGGGPAPTCDCSNY